MHPELFEIPFLHISVKSYGTLMVIGFLLAVWLMRRMMKRVGQNADNISNIAMYALVCGIIGARVFYVIHYHDLFRGRPLEVFAVWQGGLEFLGGVITAIGFVLFYLWKFKLPKRLYLDVLAVGLMVGLGFGRLGCLMNGCCYGKCTDVSWAVQFPYGSPAFYSQIGTDEARGRTDPLLDLPDEYYRDGYLKDFDELTQEQKHAVQHGSYHTLAVHPTQIYSSISAFILAGILYGLWRFISRRKPGIVLSCMFILYGPMRFWLETLRDDNPFEAAWWIIYKGGTVSQNIGIYMFIIGIILLTIFATRKPEKIQKQARPKTKN
ncbi:MAG: prolipoprotein diacylglyceryl transferase [Planctomycetota bacterium]|jgi:phosphatidylglycerol:prolipoprotein diacylglycerol transferase